MYTSNFHVPPSLKTTLDIGAVQPKAIQSQIPKETSANRWYQSESLDPALPTAQDHSAGNKPGSHLGQPNRHTSKSTKKVSVTLDARNHETTLDHESATVGSRERRMLPSSFTRTSHQRHYLKIKGHLQSEKTIGPADYDLEPILGNNSATQFKAAPKYTMPKSSTHRGPVKKVKSSSVESLRACHENRLITIDPALGYQQSPPKCFHGSRPAYPGVGHYNVESASIRQVSPKTVFGRQKRWVGTDSLNRFKS